jgi:hypothetical protein
LFYLKAEFVNETRCKQNWRKVQYRTQQSLFAALQTCIEIQHAAGAHPSCARISADGSHQKNNPERTPLCILKRTKLLVARSEVAMGV